MAPKAKGRLCRSGRPSPDVHPCRWGEHPVQLTGCFLDRTSWEFARGWRALIPINFSLLGEKTCDLVSKVHEGKLGQNLGREFQVLQVAKREVRTRFILREAFATDLDDSKHIVL